MRQRAFSAKRLVAKRSRGFRGRIGRPPGRLPERGRVCGGLGLGAPRPRGPSRPLALSSLLMFVPLPPRRALILDLWHALCLTTECELKLPLLSYGSRWCLSALQVEVAPLPPTKRKRTIWETQNPNNVLRIQTVS